MVLGIAGKYPQKYQPKMPVNRQPISCENSAQIIRTNQGKIVSK
jgi:hypothetical protein